MNIDIESDEQLTRFVQKISLLYFDWEFQHEAHWNGRLRSTGGRFFPRDSHLDFNPKFRTHPDFPKIVLHELVHYHLYQRHQGYKHADAAFKQLLAQVGGLRYAPALENRVVKHEYVCADCGQIYQRQRKIDTVKYRCGKCRGKLVEKLPKI